VSKRCEYNLPTKKAAQKMFVKLTPGLERISTVLRDFGSGASWSPRGFQKFIIEPFARDEQTKTFIDEISANGSFWI
jgi:hypothetical protein